MVLETERLILREWQLGDVNDLVEGLNDINVSKWLAVVPYPYTEDDAKWWINHCISNRNDESQYQFAIVLKSENKVIGGVSIERIDKSQGTAGGGIWTSAKYHGKGYGREAWGKRIEFAFDNLGLRRLENGCFAGNNASCKMQESFGAKVEGLKRQSFICKADGQIKDENTLALLKEEWIRNI